MVGETCESIMLGRDTCGQPANPCPTCHRAYCSQCYRAHAKDHEPHTRAQCRWCRIEFWHKEDRHPEACPECRGALASMSPPSRRIVEKLLEQTEALRQKG